MANVTTIAGGWWGSKYVSGKGTDVELVYPTGITVDAIGNVYFTDQGQTLIRKITPMGALSTIAGSLYMVPNFADGPSNRAIFSFSEGVTVNSIGDLYVADSGNNLIRKISSSPP